MMTDSKRPGDFSSIADHIFDGIDLTPKHLKNKNREVKITPEKTPMSLSEILEVNFNGNTKETSPINKDDKS